MHYIRNSSRLCDLKYTVWIPELTRKRVQSQEELGACARVRIVLRFLWIEKQEEKIEFDYFLFSFFIFELLFFFNSWDGFWDNFCEIKQFLKFILAVDWFL
jgi:hypothetical protein